MTDKPTPNETTPPPRQPDPNLIGYMERGDTDGATTFRDHRIRPAPWH